MTDRYYDANRKLWAAWTKLHEGSSFYDLASFREGGVRLREYELEEVGDVQGKDLLHLQCHIGTDTLSWARLGANVTGVDFSDEALTVARTLAVEIGVDARFVLSSIEELTNNLVGEFDIVYTSRGTIWWLHDLDVWALTIAHFLRPGGIFYITEFHPVLMTLSGDEPMRVAHPYFAHSDPQSFEVDGSYADRATKHTPQTEHGWAHPVSEVVSALAAADLRIEFFHEFDWVDYQMLSWLRPRDEGRFGLPPEVTGELPLMYSIRARKD